MTTVRSRTGGDLLTGLGALPLAVTIVGSGGPVALGRAASSCLVSLDGVPRILVDVGPGAFARLGEMRVDLGTVDTLLLTHLHVDHAGDMPGYVKSRDLSTDGTLTFRVSGPLGAGPYPSTTTFVDRLFGEDGAFGYLRGFRDALRFAVTDLPIAPGNPPREVLREGDLRVTSIAVDHGEAPAVAYRIEHAGHAAVFSGDLASKNDNLARLAADADVVVYDTSVLDPPGSEKPLYDLHTPPRRIGEVASAARTKMLVLSHIPPGVDGARDAVLRSVREAYAGEVRFAEDCMTVDVTR